MLPKGILFDLDDTIISFADSGIASWRQICEMYYEECSFSNSDELFQLIRSTSDWYWSDKKRARKGRNDLHTSRKEVVRLALESVGITALDLVHRISDAHSETREKLIHFFPGAKETLEYLVAHDVSLALMTNGPAEYQRNKVKRFDLERYFDVVLIEGEIGYGKPDKEVYTSAMAGLKLDAEDLWAVGDNLEWEVWGPQQLGIYSIWNDYKKKGLPESSPIVPDRIIYSIKELIKN